MLLIAASYCRRCKATLAVVAGLVLLLTLAFPARAQVPGADPPPRDIGDRRGGLVDEIVFATEGDVAKIAGLIEDGTYQISAQGITDQTVYQRIRESEVVDYDLSFGSSVELTLNPVGPEVGDGLLNPFHVPAMREALNWLVDRRYVAAEIFGGLARPRFLPIGTAVPDFARLAAQARELEVRYQPDRARALAVIEEEMTALGAEQHGGDWHYRGRPVTLRILIRSDDIRRQVGDYVANLMEDIGFRTERLYRSAEEASRIWIASDPAAGQWNIYTGSWVSILVRRDTSDSFDFYYTPRGRADPLWQAYDPDPEFDAIAERLSRGEYADLAEREDMMARALALAMRDSARVWLVDQSQIVPRAAAVQVAADLAGGVRGSQIWPLTLRFRDRVGGRMTFAAPSVLTEPWNPVAGTNWLFDRMVLRAINDAPLLPDPYTGLYRPQRVQEARLAVQAGSPVSATLDWLTVDVVDEIEVPGDTWLTWDEEAGRFLTVDEAGQAGLTARTRSTIRYEDGYFRRNWHDGSPVTPADVVLGWALTFSRADPDSPLLDPSHAPAFEVFERHFRGWRILSTDPFVVEVYSDQISPDGEVIVAQRAPNVLPWHVMALAILAEEDRELAFSSAKADRINAEWLSLVAGPSLPVLDRTLERASARRYLPFPALLGTLVEEAEIDARYANIAAWRAERRHFQIGDGPYYLHSVHPVEGALVLRHFVGFPDPADRWLGYADPPIPQLDLDGPMIVERGQAARFTIQASFRGEPYAAADIDLARFLLFDGGGGLARAGDLASQGNGNWEVTLSAEDVEALGLGPNSLEVVFTSRHVAMPVFASQPFATVPEGAAALR
jgi:peptide/nickel transport system substrate-binding protein